MSLQLYLRIRHNFYMETVDRFDLFCGCILVYNYWIIVIFYKKTLIINNKIRKLIFIWMKNMYRSASTEAGNNRICHLHKNIHLYQCLVQILLMPWSHQDQCFRLMRGFVSLPAGSDRPRASVSYEFAGDRGPFDWMFNASNFKDFHVTLPEAAVVVDRTVHFPAWPGHLAYGMGCLDRPLSICSCRFPPRWSFNIQTTIPAVPQSARGRCGSSIAQRKPLEGRFWICEVRSGKNLQARSAVVYSGPVLPSRESSRTGPRGVPGSGRDAAGQRCQISVTVDKSFGDHSASAGHPAATSKNMNDSRCFWCLRGRAADPLLCRWSSPLLPSPTCL